MEKIHLPREQAWANLDAKYDELTAVVNGWTRYRGDINYRAEVAPYVPQGWFLPEVKYKRVMTLEIKPMVNSGGYYAGDEQDPWRKVVEEKTKDIEPIYARQWCEDVQERMKAEILKDLRKLCKIHWPAAKLSAATTNGDVVITLTEESFEQRRDTESWDGINGLAAVLQHTMLFVKTAWLTGTPETLGWVEKRFVGDDLVLACVGEDDRGGYSWQLNVATTYGKDAGWGVGYDEKQDLIELKDYRKVVNRVNTKQLEPKPIKLPDSPKNYGVGVDNILFLQGSQVFEVRAGLVAWMEHDWEVEYWEGTQYKPSMKKGVEGTTTEWEGYILCVTPKLFVYDVDRGSYKVGMTPQYWRCGGGFVSRHALDVEYAEAFTRNGSMPFLWHKTREAAELAIGYAFPALLEVNEETFRKPEPVSAIRVWARTPQPKFNPFKGMGIGAIADLILKNVSERELL